MLAEARVRQQPKAGSNAGQKAAAGGGGGGGGGVASQAAAAAGESGEGDWRLRGPGRQSGLPAFKPGAVTWDTEDHTLEEGKKKKKGGKSGTTGAAAAGQGSSNGTKQSPKEWYEARHAKYITSHLTTGAMSRGFTSTVAGSVVKNERQMVRQQRRPAKKGYARLHSSLGDLNVELHCDLVPQTCENWLALARMGYYNGNIFHRSIKNFMIQVGEGWGQSGIGSNVVLCPSAAEEK
jgi:peptidyl-prolyl cis-trans isomerase-like protein 2